MMPLRLSFDSRQLFEEKWALVCLSESELQEVRDRYGHRLVVIPMKGVLTKKPGPRRWFRLVACGDYEMDVYASGADAVAVRYALKRAAEEQWSGVVIDVKAAFLNAPLVDEDDGEDPAAVAVILRPPLLVKLGFAKPGEHYGADKPIYELRQSPKRWGDHRDRRLLTMRTASGYIFRPSEAERGSLEEQEIGGQLFGLILIYVDDMLILSVELIVRGDRDASEGMEYFSARVD